MFYSNNSFIQWKIFEIFQVVDDVSVSPKELSHAIVKAITSISEEDFKDQKEHILTNVKKFLYVV